MPRLVRGILFLYRTNAVKSWDSKGAKSLWQGVGQRPMRTQNPSHSCSQRQSRPRAASKPSPLPAKAGIPKRYIALAGYGAKPHAYPKPQPHLQSKGKAAQGRRANQAPCQPKRDFKWIYPFGRVWGAAPYPYASCKNCSTASQACASASSPIESHLISASRLNHVICRLAKRLMARPSSSNIIASLGISPSNSALT